MTSPLSRHLRMIADGLSDKHEKDSVISAADLLEAKPGASCSAGSEGPYAWRCCDRHYPHIYGIVTDRQVTVDAWREGGIEFQALYPVVAQPAVTRQQIEKILCCPGGCLRRDDCFVEGSQKRWGRSKREREQADAILSLCSPPAELRCPYCHEDILRPSVEPPAAPVETEVQDTWLVGGPPDFMAMSGSVESDRVIQLHMRRKATDDDRKWLLDAINAKLLADRDPVQPSSAGTAELSDWSRLPRDLYVTSVKSIDGIVFDAQCCSVPMAIGPEVRYTQATDQPQARSNPEGGK